MYTIFFSDRSDYKKIIKTKMHVPSGTLLISDSSRYIAKNSNNELIELERKDLATLVVNHIRENFPNIDRIWIHAVFQESPPEGIKIEAV